MRRREPVEREREPVETIAELQARARPGIMQKLAEMAEAERRAAERPRPSLGAGGGDELALISPRVKPEPGVEPVE